MKFRNLVLGLAVLFSASAFAAQFKQDIFDLNAPIGQPFQLDLGTLLKAPSASVKYTFDQLPQWLVFDGQHTLSGTPQDGAMSDLIQVFAVDSNGSDVTQLDIDTNENPLQPISWASGKLTWQICLGQSLATDDLADMVFISDIPMQLPIPLVTFQLVGAPGWVVPVYKVPAGGVTASYYLTGTPTAVGESDFTIRATYQGQSADVAASVTVFQCN